MSGQDNYINPRTIRGTTGCWPCRFRKKKCTKLNPSDARCDDCERFNIECMGSNEDRPRRPGLSQEARQILGRWIKDRMKESPASYANDPPLSLRHLWEHYTPSSSLTWQTSVVESLSPTDHRRSRSLTSTISASTRSSRSMSPVTSLSSTQASPVPHLGVSPSLMEPSPAYHVSSRTTAAAPRRGGRPPPIMNAYQSTTPSMLESSAMAPLGFASSRGSVRPAPSHYATQQIGSPISHSTQSYETLAQNPLMIITDAQGGSHEAHEFMAGWSSLMPPDPFDPHGWSPSLLSPESPYAASILSTTSSFEDGSPYWGDQSLPSPNYYSQDTSTDLTPVSGASEPRGTSYGSNTQATTTVQQPHGWYTHPPFPR